MAASVEEGAELAPGRIRDEINAQVEQQRIQIRQFMSALHVAVRCGATFAGVAVAVTARTAATFLAVGADRDSGFDENRDEFHRVRVVTVRTHRGVNKSGGVSLFESVERMAGMVRAGGWLF